MGLHTQDKLVVFTLNKVDASVINAGRKVLALIIPMYIPKGY
jgi:hypothetical protein